MCIRDRSIYSISPISNGFCSPNFRTPFGMNKYLIREIVLKPESSMDSRPSGRVIFSKLGNLENKLVGRYVKPSLIKIYFIDALFILFGRETVVFPSNGISSVSFNYK